MFFRISALIVVVAFLTGTLSWSAPKKKKSEEDLTQSLNVPKDPPPAVVADVSRLTFFVSPLSAKGLLSQQVRDGLKYLLGQTRGAHIVRIRALVAGSGDLRRVPALVSEIFTDKKLPLPVVTVVQVGALPLTGAQVVMEASAVDKKATNPHGLAFVIDNGGPARDAGNRMAGSLERLGIHPDAVRQVTCFLDSLDNEADVRKQFSTSFPKTAGAYVQLRRDSAGEFSQCEATAALAKAPDRSDVIPPASQINAQAAFVGPGRIALTGAQMGFGREDKDVHLALERLGKALEGVGASWQSVAVTETYALTSGIRNRIAAQRKDLVNQADPPSSAMLVFEGLPSLDASFAIEATAIVR